MATKKSKYNPFYVIFHSKTEAQAVKAALVSNGLAVSEPAFNYALRAISSPNNGHPSLGNSYGFETYDNINQWGYGEDFKTQGHFPPKRLDGIAELITFLENGRHLDKKRAIMVTREVTITSQIEVLAEDDAEAVKVAEAFKDEHFDKAKRRVKHFVK